MNETIKIEWQDIHVVSFSGGKDSTAMLLHMMELGMKIDVVLFCDTWMEFPAMYRHVKKIEKIVKNAGINFVRLKNEKSFKYFMLEHQPQRRKSIYEGIGYSWADFRVRWCTSRMKQDLIRAYEKQLSQKYNVINYVGIACDEKLRLVRKNNLSDRHPLADWGWSESDALSYCYAKGYDWEGLYKIFKRVSCWCCPLQSLPDLRMLWKNFPDLWKELLDMDQKTWRSFRKNYSVKQLDTRFCFEQKMLYEGKSITNRDFYAALKEKIKRGFEK